MASMIPKFEKMQINTFNFGYTQCAMIPEEKRTLANDIGYENPWLIFSSKQTEKWMLKFEKTFHGWTGVNLSLVFTESISPVNSSVKKILLFEPLREIFFRRQRTVSSEKVCRLQIRCDFRQLQLHILMTVRSGCLDSGILLSFLSSR